MLDEKDADHSVKLEICKFMAVMGQRLTDHKQSFIGLSPDFVIKRIQALTTDRVVKVQMAAREALRVWKKLEQALEKVERMKMRVKFDVKDPERLIELKMQQGSGDGTSRAEGEDSMAEASPRKFMKSRGDIKPPVERGRQQKKSLSPVAQGRDRRNVDDSLEVKTQTSNQNSIARGAEVFKSNNLVEKTYLKQRAHNFQKKRTGSGGGFISEFDEKERNRKKSSFNQMREKFRDQVMHDKQNYSRTNNRSKYQNYMQDMADDQDYDNDEMEDIQDMEKPVKESQVIEKRTIPKPVSPSIEPPKRNHHQYDTGPAVQDNGEGIEEEQYDDQGEEEQHDEVQFEQEEVNFEQAQPEVGMNEEPTFQRHPRQDHTQSQVTPSMKSSVYDRTVKYDSDNEDDTRRINDDSQPDYDQSNPGHSMENKPSQFSVASTQYYGQNINNAEPSLEDTRYFGGNPYQREDDDNRYRAEDFPEDKTLKCDSESEDSAIEDTVTNSNQWGQLGHDNQLTSVSGAKNFAFDDLVMSWNQALLLLEEGLINEAYKLILSKEDDLYLIRLMTKTRPCYEQLEPQVSLKLRARVKCIERNDFVRNLLTQFLENSPDNLSAPLPGNSSNPYTTPQQLTTTNKYMRIEEYPNPFSILPLRPQPQPSQHHTYANDTPHETSQSFTYPVPPQSHTHIGTYTRSDAVTAESLRRQQMEQLKKEAAEVYEVLRRQL